MHVAIGFLITASAASCVLSASSKEEQQQQQRRQQGGGGQQLSETDQHELDQIFEAAKNGADPNDVRQKFRAFFAAKMRFPSPVLKRNPEKPKKKSPPAVVRRLGPPFSEFLDRTQRQQLMEIIKSARVNGSSQQEVRVLIDDYLAKHLSPEKLARVKKLKEQAQQQQRLTRRSVDIVAPEKHHKMLSEMLNDGQLNQVAELIAMARDQRVDSKVVDASLEKYLSGILSSEQMSAFRDSRT